MELQFNGIHAQLFNRPVETNMLGLDWMSGCFECFADVTCHNGTVQMIVGRRMSFDCRAVLAHGISDALKLLNAAHFDCSEAFLVFFDHPLVLMCRNGRFALRQKKVAGITGLDPNDFTPLTKIVNVVYEKDFYIA